MALKMIRINELNMPLGYTEEMLRNKAAKEINVKPGSISGLKTIKRSVDARKKNDVRFSVSVELSVPGEDAILKKFPQNKVSKAVHEPYIITHAGDRAHRPVVVGFGPAGMFAALILAQSGLKPVVIERGGDCDKRAEAVKIFREKRIFSEISNIQFGEGGAGTFSDGKLTTGIRDRRIRHIFEELVRFGAPDDILRNAKPHIGTDILREVVKNLRREIISLGADVIFEAKMTGIIRKNGAVSGIVYEKDGKETELTTDSVILAIGHSARDSFGYLHSSGIEMTKKIFAMGVRIEHLQSDVNRSLYGSFAGHPALPPAEYKYAVHLPNGRSLYTFCMCPGGYVVAAASEKGTAVTNGMSLFARDAVNANSALLVNVEPSDLPDDSPLSGIELQRKIERAAFIAGGSYYSLPVTLAGDFLKSRLPTGIGKVVPSIEPGYRFSMLDEIFPAFITDTLRTGLPLLAKKADFFAEPEAVITAPETRSSSPVRITRGDDLCSVSLKGLYPCGEGAGYAGGIVSAAVDGMKCAERVIES